MHEDGNNEFLVKRWSYEEDSNSNITSDHVDYVR
jgi:hypothetical protein